jgi:hypothetical protein
MLQMCTHCVVHTHDSCLRRAACLAVFLCLSCSAPHIIQSQLQEVLTTVVYCDYPQEWPGLLEAVMAHLTSGVSER